MIEAAATQVRAEIQTKLSREMEQTMAKRVLNRRELRKVSDAAEQQDQQAEAETGTKKKKAKTPAEPKAKKPRKKKEPARMCARWGVFDAGMKQIAVFDYNQRAQADQKIADLVAKKNAVYFLQIVKEPMPEPAKAED
jgi:hypothetical protein